MEVNSKISNLLYDKKVIYNFRLRYFTAISRKVVGKSTRDNP